MALARGGEFGFTRALGFLRRIVCSSSHIAWDLTSTRSLSANAAATAESAAADAAEGEKRRRRRKKKNLFEVAQFLPNWGIGYFMAKSHWYGTAYQITKINLYKSGNHGKAWGVFHKNGLPSADGPKKISGVNKHGWRYIPEAELKKLKDSEGASVEKNVQQ